MNIDDYLNTVNYTITSQTADDSITPVIVGDALVNLATLTKTSVDELENSVSIGLEYIIPNGGGGLDV